MSSLHDRRAQADQRPVILAPRNAEAIAAAKPFAIVVDLAAHRILFRGDVFLGCNPLSRCRYEPSKRYRMILAFVLSAGRCVADEDVVEFIWGDEIDGGPLAAINTLSVMRAKMDPVLKWLGIEVSRRYRDDFFVRLVEPVGNQAEAA